MGSRTMHAVLEETARNLGSTPALHQPTGKGKYQTYTWIEYQRAAEEIACGLRQIGIGKGDTVALHSETRA
jgi:long-subunit acyl-CoA synthetase (AMP-forming)